MENTALGKLAYTVAAAAVIGGGAAVLNNQSRIAVLENTNQNVEQRLGRIETKVDTLLDRTRRVR